MAANRLTALDVANWFLCNPGKCPGEAITHLKLQKLVYYAQAWSLVFFKEPLFEEDFEAWAHGPVAPSIYRAFAANGWDILTPPDNREAGNFSDDQAALLDEVAEVYGAYSAKRLEHMTHGEEPWIAARGNLPPEARSQVKIPKAAMRKFYTELHAKAHG